MKILLAIDTSPASEAAVNEIAVRLWPAGTTIEVFTVVEPSHAWTTSEVVETEMRRAGELAKAASEGLRSHGKQATPLVWSGDPKSVIVERAKQIGADWIIVGPHRGGGVAKFLLGSVAKAVVRNAPCSVEVVRATGPERASRILLATDWSESAVLAARSVAERPWPSGTEVRILSVVELVLTTFQATMEPPFVDSAAMETLRAESMKRAQDAIARAEEIVAAAGLKTSTDVSVLVDSPKQIILDEATQWGAGLIVVGSHGRRGLDRLILGSVSEAVAMHAECTVDVIRKVR
jgi:nucleotide-binding universal stress UspA family protein